MASFNYASLQRTAGRLIKMFGLTAALRPIVGSGDIDVDAVVLEYQARERDGALIMPDDRRVLVAVKTGAPAPDPETYRLVIDSTVFRIVAVRPLSPGGTVLYYDCQVRH